MTVNPITLQEIERYEDRIRLLPFSAWEVGVLVELDLKVRAVWAEKTKKSRPAQDGAGEERATVRMTDIAGIKGLFSRFRTTKPKGG